MIAGERVVGSEVIHRVAGFYSGTRVLVTGGASFIGSHLVEALLEAGALVRVADDLSSGTASNLFEVMDELEFVHGDLRDINVADRACAGRTMVFHLAALHGGRGYIDTHPVECMNNMLLDHVVFDAAAKNGVGKIVHASSACVYPTVLQADENDRCLLRESDASFDVPGRAFADGEYGWAKLMGEMQLRAFHKQFGIDAIACRIFTAYGERENESHAVVALIAKALARMDPYPIWGNGLQTRNFTYVGDTVAGLLLSGAKLTGFDAINVGSEVHHPINHLVDQIFAALSWRPNRIDRQLDRPVGVKSRAADCSKSRELLGWEPNYSLGQGIVRTADWYQSSASAERLHNLESVLMSR
jgi:nucleoside-diphosphate-sugar epimerase